MYKYPALLWQSTGCVAIPQQIPEFFGFLLCVAVVSLCMLYWQMGKVTPSLLCLFPSSFYFPLILLQAFCSLCGVCVYVYVITLHIHVTKIPTEANLLTRKKVHPPQFNKDTNNWPFIECFEKDKVLSGKWEKLEKNTRCSSSKGSALWS